MKMTVGKQIKYAAMISFARMVQGVSHFFRLSESWTGRSENGKPKQAEYFYTLGPRMMVVRENGSHLLTGMFSIGISRNEAGNIIGCRPTILPKSKNDRVYFGAECWKQYGLHFRQEKELMGPGMMN